MRCNSSIYMYQCIDTYLICCINTNIEHYVLRYIDASQYCPIAKWNTNTTNTITITNYYTTTASTTI